MRAKFILYLFICTSICWRSAKTFENSIRFSGNTLEAHDPNSPSKAVDLGELKHEETDFPLGIFRQLGKLRPPSHATATRGKAKLDIPQTLSVTESLLNFSSSSDSDTNIHHMAVKLVSSLGGEKVPETWDEIWLLAKPNFQRVMSYLDEEYAISSLHETIPGLFLEQVLNFGDKMFLLKFLKSKLDDDFADFIFNKIFKYLEPIGELDKIYDNVFRNSFGNSTDNFGTSLVSNLIEYYGDYLMDNVLKLNSLNQIPQFIDHFLPPTNDSADTKNLLLFSLGRALEGRKLKRVERESLSVNRRQGRVKYIQKDSGYQKDGYAHDSGYGKGSGKKHDDGYSYDDGYGHDDGYGYDDGYGHDDGYGDDDGYGHDGYGHDSGYGEEHGDKKHKGGYKTKDGYGHSSGGGYGYGSGGYGSGYGGSGHGSSYGGGGYSSTHGGGYGSSHGGSYMPSHATIDPYVVLGALALGTLLAFLLYRIINGTGASGREIPDHSFLLWLSDAPDVDNQPAQFDSLDRPERSIKTFGYSEKTQRVIPELVNLEEHIKGSKYPINDLNTMWRAYKLSKDNKAVRDNLCRYLRYQATVENLAGVDSMQSLIMASAGALLGLPHAGHLLDGEAYSRMASPSPALPLHSCSL